MKIGDYRNFIKLNQQHIQAIDKVEDFLILVGNNLRDGCRARLDEIYSKEELKDLFLVWHGPLSWLSTRELEFDFAGVNPIINFVRSSSGCDSSIWYSIEATPELVTEKGQQEFINTWVEKECNRQVKEKEVSVDAKAKRIQLLEKELASLKGL